MKKLTREDLYSLEKYSEIRSEFRTQVMAHKKDRRVQFGDHVALYFEDRLTMQYQVQEMLRIEKIFEVEGIEDELSAYNPLIPDGSNLKATMMIEYIDVEERRLALTSLIGIEEKVWVKVDAFDPVWAIADEDLERESEEKTSSVHFLRFQLNDDMIKALRKGATISAGVAHPEYDYQIEPLQENITLSLLKDFS